MAYEMPILDIADTDAAPSETKVNGHRHDLPAISMGAVYATPALLQPGPDPLAVATVVANSTRFHSARQQIDILTQRNACLERKLAALTQQEMQARYLALHDSLTGLPNRRLLKDRFRQAIAGAMRHRKPLALLLLDVNGFKWVNDKLGHAVGDRLLVSMVQRLTAGIRGGDTACRYGGDEFVLLLSEIDHREAAANVAGKVGTCLAAPYLAGGYRIQMSVSIGAAVYPFDGHTYEALMVYADKAMYRQKNTAGAQRTSILMPLAGDTHLDADTQKAMGGADVIRLDGTSFFDQDTA